MVWVNGMLQGVARGSRGNEAQMILGFCVFWLQAYRQHAKRRVSIKQAGLPLEGFRCLKQRVARSAGS